MSSFFGGLGRRVGVLIYGDDRQLQKTLARTETRLAAFGKKADAIGKGGILGGGTKAFAGFAGAGAAALTIQKFISASRDAEVVLGQTSVAVKNAGIAWEQNSGKIDAAATRISEASGFDDEDVLRSFQVFVRGQKDVAKSIDLSALAADVARGRYTDLASGTQLVNKAAMGQIGALRRAGIQIDKNATATEALTALQKAYGGAAKQYADSAAGAADNLAVAWENLAEVAGGPLNTGLAKVTNGLTFVVKQMAGLTESAKLTKETLSDPKFIQAVQALNGTFKGVDLLNQLHANQIVAPGEGRPTPPPMFGGSPLAGYKPPKQGLVTSVSAKLEDNLLNARISGNDKAIKDALQDEANFLKSALSQKRLNRKQRTGLKEALLSVTDEINGINQAAADAAKQAAEDAKKKKKPAKIFHAEIPQKLQERLIDAQLSGANNSIKAALVAEEKFLKGKIAHAGNRSKRLQWKDILNDVVGQLDQLNDTIKTNLANTQKALKEKGEAIKSAALAQLDLVQDKRNVQRDLVDAKDALSQAKRIGGRHGILEAQRGLQDAELARKRFLLEQATVTPAGKTAKAGFNFAGATFHFHGVQNVKQLQAELAKLSNRSTSQSRGHSPGIPHGL